MSEYTCQSVRHLLALRPEAWSDDERQRVQAHLAGCAGCAALARDYAGQDRLFVQTAPRVGLSAQQRASLEL